MSWSSASTPKSMRWSSSPPNSHCLLLSPLFVAISYSLNKPLFCCCDGPCTHAGTERRSSSIRSASGAAAGACAHERAIVQRNSVALSGRQKHDCALLFPQRLLCALCC
jgi:hypothetical protein